MGNLNRGRYIIDRNGDWTQFVKVCPEGWKMLGTIQSGKYTGALALHKDGRYVLVNKVQTLPLTEQKVVATFTALDKLVP